MTKLDSAASPGPESKCEEQSDVVDAVPGARTFAGGTDPLLPLGTRLAICGRERVLALRPHQGPWLLNSRRDLRAVSRGVPGPAAPSRPRCLYVDDRGACISRAAGAGVRLAALGARAAGHDDGDPAVRLPERVAPAHPLDRLAVADHRPGTGILSLDHLVWGRMRSASKPQQSPIAAQ